MTVAERLQADVRSEVAVARRSTATKRLDRLGPAWSFDGALDG